jgi:hypothetical protein
MIVKQELRKVLTAVLFGRNEKNAIWLEKVRLS